MSFSSHYSKFTSALTVRRLRTIAAAIARQESWAKNLSDQNLRAEFEKLKALPLLDRAPRGFALAREAILRTQGVRLFDTQVMGGLALLQGLLAEMRTGEGKTLAIVAPAALQALDGAGVHVVTANAYLASRDAQLLAPTYALLGLTSAALGESDEPSAKQAAYACDVTYGAGQEFGFDFLRDRLVRAESEKCQRPLHSVIVDEIDSILIDEARVPLLIAGTAADRADEVRAVDSIVQGLVSGRDYSVNLKEQSAVLTESGHQQVETGLVALGLIETESALYAPENLRLASRINAAVRAYGLLRRDRDYLVRGNELLLIDPSTGRAMTGRRFEGGLHEALEAKEQLPILPGTTTRASITFQHFFSAYQRLSGLSGTAATDAEEFSEIYGLKTVVIPTHVPPQRKTLEDVVFLSKRDKFQAVVAEVQRLHQTGQPVLVGCATVRDAELVSKLLGKVNILHNLLTAKQHAAEARIVAEAGRFGAVTVATDMAGRGTDILLGGPAPLESDYPSDASHATAVALWRAERLKIVLLGGLHVMGTERHGLRRVDNQLAGRCGRQGDPGSVQFYLSLEDDLLQVFGQSRSLALLRNIIDSNGGAAGGALTRRLITEAQLKIENQGFGARKQLMQADNVLAAQRDTVYALRDELLRSGARVFFENCADDALTNWLSSLLSLDVLSEQWDLLRAQRELRESFGLDVPLVRWVREECKTDEDVHTRIRAALVQRVSEVTLEPEELRAVVLEAVDSAWTEYLEAFDELRQNLSLKGATGFNPAYRFKNDAIQLFQGFQHALARALTQDVLGQQKTAPSVPRDIGLSADAKVAIALERRWVLRTEPCPCESGKRYRDCHGALKPVVRSSP